MPGMCRVTCGHCHDTFLVSLPDQRDNGLCNFCVTLLPFKFNTLTNALARCPHCRKVSSVGVDFARNRSNVYMAFGILFLAVGIAVAWTTYAHALVS